MSKSKMNVSAREFLERIIDERDRRYEERDQARQLAVKNALDAQEKSVSAAFLSAKEAIAKAADAQDAYNIVHNDLSRKLEVQAKDMMQRTDVLALLNALEQKTQTTTTALKEDIKTVHTAVNVLQNLNATTQGRLLSVGVFNAVLTIGAVVLAHFLK